MIFRFLSGDVSAQARAGRLRHGLHVPAGSLIDADASVDDHRHHQSRKGWMGLSIAAPYRFLSWNLICYNLFVLTIFSSWQGKVTLGNWNWLVAGSRQMMASTPTPCREKKIQ
jgi:hypothetical protein